MELRLSNKDYYKIHKASLIADYDIKTIEALYQPIISSAASMLYYTFLNETNFQEWVPITSHEMLCKKTNLNLSELLIARKKLEAIGLLKTFYKTDENNSTNYIYYLYAPKTPGEFFKDPLYVGLLTSIIGEKEVSRLKRLFTVVDPDLDGYFDITTSYKAMYDNNRFALIPEGDRIFSALRGNIKSNFDEKEFLSYMKEKYGIAKKSFDEKTMFEIGRLALLFGIKEEDMASKVGALFDIETKSLDLDDLYNLCRNSLIVPQVQDENSNENYDSDSLFARKVNMMDNSSPFEFLRTISNFSNPSPADIQILNVLSRDYGLSNGVINAIVEYTLNVCDQDLPRPYCEKLASKLKRKNVKTAMEAINALVSRKGKTKVMEEKEVDEPAKEEISVSDLQKIMEDL